MKMKSDEQAIRDLYAAWRKATLEEDLPGILKLIDDDAVFLVPGQPPMRGKQHFTAMFDTLRSKYTFEAKSEFDEIVVHGDWAHVVCRMAAALTPKSGGAAEIHSGHTLTILHKRHDGSWVVVRDANLLARENKSG